MQHHHYMFCKQAYKSYSTFALTIFLFLIFSLPPSPAQSQRSHDDTGSLIWHNTLTSNYMHSDYYILLQALRDVHISFWFCPKINIVINKCKSWRSWLEHQLFALYICARLIFCAIKLRAYGDYQNKLVSKASTLE